MLGDDLKAAVANITAKNDALLALTQKLVDAAKNNPPPADIQAAIDALNAEASKDDATLNPPPPA